ncbi:MAG: PIN domain-containing protein [Pseudonocardia sp.]
MPVRHLTRSGASPAAIEPATVGDAVRIRVTVAEWVREAIRAVRHRNPALDRIFLSARDALHIAVMRRHRVEQIMTFDEGFERYPGIRRIC